MSLLINPYAFGGGPLIFDSFDRADNSSSLGTADIGGAWGGEANLWRIVSNSAKEQSGQGPVYTIPTIDAGTPDVDITVHVVPSNATPNDFGLIARFTDSSNHLIFDVTKLGGGWLCRAFEKIGGGGYSGVTTLQSPPAGLDNTFDPFRLRLVTNGTAGEIFLTSMADPDGAWNSMGTWTINGALTGTKVGMAANQADGVAWDDFRVVHA